METKQETTIVSANERKRMQAMLGNPKEQVAKYLINEKGKKEILGEEQVNSQATIYFKNCHDCEYTVDALCTKIMIEGCTNTKVILNKKIVTHTVDVWKCNDFHLVSNTYLGTLQIDICKKLTVDYANKELFNSIVWAGVFDMTINFQDSTEHNLVTGFNQMKEAYPKMNLSDTIDQFIIRFLKGKLTSEQIVRLENGFPTTEREAAEFDRKQEEALQKLAKDAGISIGKKKVAKVKPNEPCTCGSEKKYKKCCGKNM